MYHVEESLHGIHESFEALALLLDGDAASDAVVSELDGDHFVNRLTAAEEL